MHVFRLHVADLVRLPGRDFARALLLATLGCCSHLRANSTIAEPPAAIRQFLPPIAPYTLDAGASQIVPLDAKGSATTNVEVTVASPSGMPATAKFHWSISKAPEGPAGELGTPDAARSALTVHRPGAYFLRVDVTVGDWTDWQSVVVQAFSPSETGFALDRFPAPPKPGIHPRIFFNPDQVPAIRKHLKDSVIGRDMAKKLEINARLLRDGMAGFDAKAPLAKLFDGTPAVVNAGFFANESKTYRKLVAGDLHALGEEVRAMGEVSRLAEQMAADALWCLLTDDKKGAQELAAAMTTWARIVTPTIKPEDDFQWDNATFGLRTYGKQEMGRIFDKVGRENIGLCYDFIYNDMTPEQRDVVRAMISRATAGKVGYGTDQPHYVRNGNWVTFHTTALMLLSLAIEGESGYDPSIYRQGAQTFQDFYQYSILENGESFESLGKGGASPLIVIPMAKRGDWVAAHPHLRNYYRRYMLNCLEPYGYHYIALSTRGDSNLSGGLMLDACVAKQCYPEDPVIEEVYRNLLGENYGGSLTVEQLLPLSLWGQDFKIPAGKPWEWDKSKPLTYVGRDQGLVVTRSDWIKNALYLFFDCGSNIRDMGHYDPARNLFILSALGRNWLADTGKEETAEAHSVVLIDGKGGSKCFGKLADVHDEANYTSLCGDSKYAYDWEWNRSGRKGEIDPTTINQIRFEPLPERFMQTPLTHLYSFFAPFRLVREPWNPVLRAYRTALLRRGEHPYVVIGDDIQKDDQPHRYEFILRLPDDLADHFQVSGNRITLSDPSSNRRLLVQVVAPDTIEVTSHKVEIRKDTKLSKTVLSIATTAVKPDFRILFYPYLEGAELPKAAWHSSDNQLIIENSSFHDVCSFQRTDAGLPQMKLVSP